MRKMIAAAAAVLLLPLPSAAGAGELPEAKGRAWVLKLSLPGQEPIELAQAAAQSGSSPSATAAPWAVGSESPLRATATADQPEDVKTPFTYVDQTGSFGSEGGFSEARASSAGSTGRAGLGSFQGSGFAMASELMSWEQQEQLLGAWLETNMAVFTPLNESLQALTPALAPLGLSIPRLEYMPSTGFVDVGKGRSLAASVETASASSFSSARSTAEVGTLRLFAGFIEASGIEASAVAESAIGAGTREARSTIDRLRIAGIEVVADSEGLRAAGNKTVVRDVLQPALDAVLAAAAQAGLTIKVNASGAEGDLQQATGLLVEMATPEGVASLSIAHAEAVVEDAAMATPALPVPPVIGGPSPASGEEFLVADGAAPVGAPADPLPEIAPASPATASGTPAAPIAAPRLFPLGADAARAMRTTYLLLFVIGTLAALAVPTLLRTNTRPARPLQEAR